MGWDWLFFYYIRFSIHGLYVWNDMNYLGYGRKIKMRFSDAEGAFTMRFNGNYDAFCRYLRYILI